MILHIISTEKFTTPFIEFSNDAFADKCLHFAIYGSSSAVGFHEPGAQNVTRFDSLEQMIHSEIFNELVQSAKLIIISYVRWKLITSLRKTRKKTMLLFWGGDLYPYIQISSFNLKRLVKREILKWGIRSYKGVLNLCEPDRQIVIGLGAHSDSAFLVDMSGVTAKIASEHSRKAKCLRERNSKPTNPYLILLGNSATETNRHQDMIDALSHFKNKSIKIVVPLSYGDDKYRDATIEYGRSCLGECFIPLVEYMDREAYRELLASISVGVFNFNRQQGLGNVRALLSFGAKVFLPYGTPMWDACSCEGVTVFDASNIATMSFDEFLFIDEHISESNAAAVDSVVRWKRAVERWEKVYSISQ